jgi:endonuclease YncB( thermonuclease family)
MGLIAAGTGFWLAGVPRELAGRPAITDGDSLRLSGYRVRLAGIDAPEILQVCQRAGQVWRCGEDSRRSLATKIGTQRVICNPEGRDRYARLLALCRAGATDLNAQQVREGWAFAFGRFAQEEEQARAAKAGIWSGTFEPLREFRRRSDSWDWFGGWFWS